MSHRPILAAMLLVLPMSAAGAQDLAKVRQACDADVRRLCQGIQPGGGRILQCMRDHSGELSQACLVAIADAALTRAALRVNATGPQGGGAVSP